MHIGRIISCRIDKNTQRRKTFDNIVGYGIKESGTVHGSFLSKSMVAEQNDYHKHAEYSDNI
jgi:hypothetical protein